MTLILEDRLREELRVRRGMSMSGREHERGHRSRPALEHESESEGKIENENKE